VAECSCATIHATGEIPLKAPTVYFTLEFCAQINARESKAKTGYTALTKAPTHEMQKTESRPDHNTANSMPYSF